MSYKIVTCDVCEGMGEYKTHDCWGKTETVKCSYCDGTGKRIKQKENK